MAEMSDSYQAVVEDAASNPGSAPLSRRNLPRASQACQMCRVKKARCNQRQPCSNCHRHSFSCIYPPKGRRKRNSVSLHYAGTPQGANEEAGGGGSLHLVQNQEFSHHLNHLHGREAENSSGSPSARGQEQKIDAQSRSAFQSEDDLRSSDEDVEDELQQPDSDIVGDVNKHTSGTEFYGTSSNFVLLNQLFSHARLQASSANSGGVTSNGTSALRRLYSVSGDQGLEDHGIGSGPTASGANANRLSHLGDSRLSIVNLLYNDEATLPPSRPKTPLTSGKETQVSLNAEAARESAPRNGTARQGATLGSSARSSQGIQPSLHSSRPKSPSDRSRQNKTSAHIDYARKTYQPVNVRLEKEYMRIFFSNLHHLHPMLLVDEFTARCQAEVWNRNPAAELRRDRMHFLALYNIIVAVGALIAGRETLHGFENELGVREGLVDATGLALSKTSLTISKTYFQKARSLLGDMFEVCSLESAQTLFYISLYCQNALKPHSCYMYSGMAVRTALAIGLPSESMSRSSAARRAARRTWWCIYSHEIDMCCSSGRRDSLMKPENYLIPLPQIRDLNPEASEIEEHNMSMINEMVHFSVILRRASKQIYHDSKGLTLYEKSVVALELDALLDTWRSSLPLWLNLDAKSLRESEWASKQKLVLQLRYLNARILLHRPFLASSASADFLQLERNIELCLEAARKTINLFYESYEHRHYFRSWWYNTTYTLYAGMIVLYIILLNYTKVSGEELLRDVEKSRELLLAMEEASVAQRSAKLMGEVLEVARTYISQRQQSGNSEQTSGFINTDGQMDFNYDSMNFDSDWSRTLFAHNLPGSSRGDILATLIDPNILQDFAAGNDYSNRSVTSSVSVPGQFYGSPDQGEVGDHASLSGQQWSVPWGTFSEPSHMQTGIW